ncbi:MAG: alpha/beta hydrolase [Holosporaceae bacterium]|jgi:alpha/beta superfamily hydrolase|nr:alpha/beta hydrolase [Holosporaceae bacterium]
MPEIVLTGHAGRIEAKYHHSRNPKAPLAIILHPNPLQGGSMNNRVTVSLYSTFVKNGFSVIRFNFRGVGKSEGVHDKGEGELTDAAAVLDWIQSINQGQRAIWIAGFSFGSLIGMQLLMRRPEISGFVSVCPPANIYDFSFLAPCPVSGMIINGENDQICPILNVNKLVDKLNNQRGISIDYRIISDCDHSFQNYLTLIHEYVTEYLEARNVIKCSAAARVG